MRKPPQSALSKDRQSIVISGGSVLAPWMQSGSRRMQVPVFFRELYEQSQAAALGLSFSDFAEALCRAGGDATTRSHYQHLHLNDLALAQACIMGIPSAWERFALRYRERLYRAALILARDETAARELTDSIYGEVFDSKLRSYSARGPLEGWLKAVLSRAYIDRYRTQRRTVSLDARLGSIRQTLFENSPPVVDPRLNDAIKEAFLVLPAEERFVLAGYFFDQRPLAELAQTLGVHESTVSRRLNRLLQLLRRRIMRILRQKGMTVRQAEESLATDVRDLTLDFAGELRSQLVRE